MKKSACLKINNVPDVDTRISLRRTVGEEEYSAVANSPPDKRYKYFTGKVVDNAEIWSVWEDERIFPYLYKGKSTELDVYAYRFWPEKVFAERWCTEKNYKNFKITPIPIDDWIDEILYTDGNERNVWVAVLPSTLHDRTVVVTADTLTIDISNEWNSRFGNIATEFSSNDPDKFLNSMYCESMNARPKGYLP